MLESLLVFDIDGTLMAGSGEGTSAYLRAIHDLFGIQARPGSHPTAGKTDLLILRELAEKSGLRLREGDEAKLARLYLVHLEEDLRRRPGQVLPGVKPLLARLAAEPGVFLALGTGNLERAARCKLALHGLDGYFLTGGFGSDAAERERIIAVAIGRAEKVFRTRFRRIVVVGDTPLDVGAAAANGVAAIAVATGPYGLESLREAGAAELLPDLSDTDDFLHRLEGLPLLHRP